jgi:carotenoid cleavage dioxygenase-like enzyme
MATALSQTQATDHSLGFTSLDEETSLDSVPVRGELPAWLRGALVRVTPAQLDAADHWFDGLAMLNRFGFEDGRVSYASRYIRSRAWERRGEGRVAGGFGTDPCKGIFKRVQSVFSPEVTDNPNVNLARIGERYIAMTETPLPIEFDPDSLESLGPFEFGDALRAHVTTAHPHHDPERDELVNYVARFSRTSEYVLYGLPAGSSERRVIARMPVKEPAYMHAFAMSERHLVLCEYPLRANPLKLALSGKAFIQNYEWRPEQGTRFQVFDRASGTHRGTFETDAFFCFHHVNSFERDGSLVIDLVAYDDPAVIDALYLGEHGPRGTLPPTELRRYELDLDGGGVSWSALPGGHNVELPRIDYSRRNGRDYGFAWFAGYGEGWMDRLVKVGVRDGTRLEWSAPGCFPGEPVFVRDPGAEAEDAGVILSVVLDAQAGHSFLLVLDAATLEELARADAPHHIPFGFHGQFLRG